jgi:hypothetical protein
MAKDRQMAKARKKTSREKVVDAALSFAPAPVRAVASNPIGFRLLVIAMGALMATGILSLDWNDGKPQFNVDRERAQQVRQELVEDLRNKIPGWDESQNQGAGFAGAPFGQQPASAQPIGANPNAPNGYYPPTAAASAPGGYAAPPVNPAYGAPANPYPPQYYPPNSGYAPPAGYPPANAYPPNAGYPPTAGYPAAPGYRR